jgi:hypothetical protein
MAIDIGKGILRIYIVLASLYVIFMFILGISDRNSFKNNYEWVLIGNVTCEKLREVASNRVELEKQEKATLDSVELKRLDMFLDKYNLEKTTVLDMSGGCHGKVDKNLSFYEKNSGLILFAGWLGLLPAIIIYFLLSFIINGFRSKK